MLIIPHTLQVTTIGALQPGDRVNLEVDQMARYAARLLDHPQSQGVFVMAGPRRGGRNGKDGKGARILIVEARFYDDIADALLAGATKALKEAGATFDCLSVPGALEIPTTIAIALDAARRGGAL